jgi:pimeloyl-ACP methyl ester carboxylesterase
MLRRTFVGAAAVAGVALTNSIGGRAQTDAGTPGASTPIATEPQAGYAEIDGLEMYYEVHGTATGSHPPLLLLHGGLLTIDLAFGQLIPVLAQSRQVIAVELEGHGRSALTDRPLSYEQMADDTAALLGEIDLAQVDIFGYSLGGGVALQIAIRHPDLARKLVVASAPVRADGWHPEILGAMASLGPEAAAAMEATPLYQAYAAVAPNPDDWPNLVTRVGQLTTGEYDWSADVAAIAAPTLLIFGDADSVRPEHIIEMLQVLGGGVVGDMGQTANVQLAVLPNTAHSAVLMQTDLLLAVIVPFLDAPMPESA